MAADETLVVVPLDRLREIFREAIDTALAGQQASAPARLLDRADLAEMLGCSLPTLDKLRSGGMPELRVGDAPRFEREAVLAWLRERSRHQ
jgi:excisionase family DNA binding protein